MLFRLLFAIDLAIAAILASYFSDGLAQGWISSFNIQIWLAVILGVAAILLGGYLLRRIGRTWLANIVLAILALPGALYGLFIVAVIVSGTPWN